jgi:hypothetical protein
MTNMPQFQLSNNLIFKHPTTFHDIHQSKITTKNIWGRVNEYRDEKSPSIKKTLRKYFHNNLQAQHHWQCDNQILKINKKHKKKPNLKKYRIVPHCEGEFVDIPDIHKYSKNCKAQAEAIFGKKHIQNCIENQKILNILFG